MRIRPVDHLIAQYLWLTVISLPALTIIGWDTTQLTSDFFSAKPTSPFHSDEDPVWFMHTTDLSIDARLPTSYSVVYERLHRALTLLRPQKVFVSGGVVSNCEHRSYFQYERQHSEDWNLYEMLISELSVNASDVFVVAGDSEVFGVESFDSEDNFARRLFGSSEDGYRTQVRRFGKFRVILLNPYDFPTPPYGLVRWASPSLAHRRAIRELLTSVDDVTTIVLSHHPAMMWTPSFDTSRIDVMRMMLAAATNTRFFLSGHIDPEFPILMHHGDVLEAVCSPLATFARVGMVTFDNNRAAYHTVELTEETVVILTYPTPLSQISGLDVFNRRDFSVRALVFGRENVTLNVHGAVEGRLEKQRILRPNVSLWALPCRGLGYGKHRIEMSGDWDGECEFFVGNSLVGFREPNYLHEGNVQNQFLFVWFFAFAAVIAVPVSLRGIGEDFDRVEPEQRRSWLVKGLGFLVVKRRIRQMPTLFQGVFFAATMWPIALPISFFKSESLLGMVWLYGYLCGWRAFSLAISALAAFCYLGFVITPVALMASAFIATKFRHPVVIVDGVVYCAGLIGNVLVVRYGIVDEGLFAGFTSPCFLIIPVILHGMLWFFIGQMILSSTRADDQPLIW
jgi:hypothetical protein